MTRYEPGEVLLLRFPFTDATGSKQRPALVVLDTGDDDVLVARMTRQACSSLQDVDIVDWSAAGLLAPSTARLHKLAVLSKSLVVRSFGKLSTSDRARVGGILSSLFDSFV